MPSVDGSGVIVGAEVDVSRPGSLTAVEAGGTAATGDAAADPDVGATVPVGFDGPPAGGAVSPASVPVEIKAGAAAPGGGAPGVETPARLVPGWGGVDATATTPAEEAPAAPAVTPEGAPTKGVEDTFLKAGGATGDMRPAEPGAAVADPPPTGLSPVDAVPVGTAGRVTGGAFGAATGLTGAGEVTAVFAIVGLTGTGVVAMPGGATTCLAGTAGVVGGATGAVTIGLAGTTGMIGFEIDGVPGICANATAPHVRAIVDTPSRRKDETDMSPPDRNRLVITNG